MAKLSVSRRTRRTPFTTRVEALGVSAYTVYNNMLLATCFRSFEADYWHLCQHVQVWDVSCERQVQIKGPDAFKLVQLMTPRNLSRAQDDQCFYLPLCDQNGKMINDPIAIHIESDTWWLSIADSDVRLWAKGLATGMDLDVNITELNIWPIAIQGPKADELMRRVFGEIVDEIRFFRYKQLDYNGHKFIVARSGWSKQGGFEVYVDDAEIGCQLWDELFEKGVDLNVGPGCPNIIERIESGLLSFGSDMDFRHTPLQCGLKKYCHLDQDIDSLSIDALRKLDASGVPSQLMGLMAVGLNEMPDNKTIFLDSNPAGEVYSDCISPRYGAYLAFAELDSKSIENVLQNDGDGFTLELNGEHYPLKCTELPFKFESI